MGNTTTVSKPRMNKHQCFGSAYINMYIFFPDPDPGKNLNADLEN